MEQVSEPARQIDATPQKMSKGQIIGMVVLTIIALAGVAFGVFGMVGKNEAEKERDLAIKITDTAGKVTDIITDKITSIDENGTVTEITDTNVTTEAVNPEDYIYIGEWGIKIKTGDDFGLVGLDRVYAYDGDENGGAFHLSAASEDLLEKFNAIGQYPVMGIRIFRTTNSKCHSADRGEWNSVYNDGEYNYCIYKPASAVGDEYESLRDEIMDDWNSFERILNNSDNYSKI